MALESIANRRASGFAKVKHGGEEETIGVVYGAPIWVSGSPAVLEMHELDVELEEASARDVLAAALGELAARIPGRWFDARKLLAQAAESRSSLVVECESKMYIIWEGKLLYEVDFTEGNVERKPSSIEVSESVLVWRVKPGVVFVRHRRPRRRLVATTPEYDLPI